VDFPSRRGRAGRILKKPLKGTAAAIAEDVFQVDFGKFAPLPKTVPVFLDLCLSKSMLSFSLPRRKRENFIFGKANFAAGCGRSGEKFNAAKNKIFRLQPGKEKLNML